MYMNIIIVVPGYRRPRAELRGAAFSAAPGSDRSSCCTQAPKSSLVLLLLLVFTLLTL